MGWDAYATKDGETIECRYESDIGFIRSPKDPVLEAAFAEAAKRPGASDGMLREGALGLTGCGKALQEATGLNAWNEDGWDAETVKAVAASARWDGCDERYRESARAFLETCAGHGLGIRFSY